MNVLIRKISKQVDEGISSSIYACIYIHIVYIYMYIYIYLNMASDCICSRNEDSYMSYTTIYNLQYFLYRVATHRQVQVWLRLNTPKLSALMNVISRLILTKLAIISYWIGTSLTQLGTGLKDKKNSMKLCFA